MARAGITRVCDAAVPRDLFALFQALAARGDLLVPTLMDALGYSEAKVVEEKVEIRFDELHAVHRGAPGKATWEQLQTVIARPEFAVDIDLRLGKGEAVVYTCNCTEEYVRVNV